MMVFNEKLKYSPQAKLAAVILGDIRMKTKPSKAFASIKQGLDEALEFATVSESKAIVRQVTDIEIKNS